MCGITSGACCKEFCERCHKVMWHIIYEWKYIQTFTSNVESQACIQNHKVYCPICDVYKQLISQDDGVHDVG